MYHVYLCYQCIKTRVTHSQDNTVQFPAQAFCSACHCFALLAFVERALAGLLRLDEPGDDRDDHDADEHLLSRLGGGYPLGISRRRPRSPRPAMTAAVPIGANDGPAPRKGRDSARSCDPSCLS